MRKSNDVTSVQRTIILLSHAFIEFRSISDKRCYSKWSRFIMPWLPTQVTVGCSYLTRYASFSGPDGCATKFSSAPVTLYYEKR